MKEIFNKIKSYLKNYTQLCSLKINKFDIIPLKIDFNS